MRISKIFPALFFAVFPMLVFADVPIMTAPTEASSDNLARLEKQVEYLQQLNIPARISMLQQTIQDLRGLIEVQGHEIQQLQTQLRNQLQISASDKNQNVQPTALSAPISSKISKTAPAMPTAIPPVPKAKPKIANNDDKQAYLAAFNLISDKQYSEAFLALKNYLKQYPNGQYAANAHYWLGELFALDGKSDKAISELNIVTTNYSTSNRAPDALLKLGSISYDQSRWQQTKQYWQKIISQYPNSSAARIAFVNMQKLKRAGY